jgi:hypothetical protein
MNSLRSKDGQHEIMAHAAHTLDMVGMIMRNEDAMHLAEAQSVVTEILLQRTDAHTSINDETVSLCIQIVAVSATSTSK